MAGYIHKSKWQTGDYKYGRIRLGIYFGANYYQDPVTYQLVREQLERRNDIFMTGFGYNEILPSMDHWERQGTDGSNENPHNFLIYALGRRSFIRMLVIHFIS